jgi:DnaJ-class molecular chaperone with C-terminal Zn finger domain
MFSWIRNWFSSEKSGTTQPVLAEVNTDGKEHILDPSSSVPIVLPQIEKPKFDEDHKPQEYWAIYNKGVSLYSRKGYEKAKDEFLKLLNYDRPHNTFFTYLLKTYRKIINKHIEKKKFQNAFDISEEFLRICADYVTDHDRRNHNKIIEKLKEKTPDLSYNKINLTKKEKEPAFTIGEAYQTSLTLLNETKTIKENLNKTSWNFVDRMGSDFIYVKNNYDNEQAKFDRASIFLRDGTGNKIREFGINHGIYRFKATEEADKFVASSDDMILYLYTGEGTCLGTYNLKGYTENKYHVRSVDISPEGSFLLFTHVDRAYLLDCNFKLLGDWRMPAKEGWERRTNNRTSNGDVDLYMQRQHYLSILGLSGNPSGDELKAAFRNVIRKYHPDINPDPTATEKTREIMNSYEKLSGEDATKALRDLDNAEYYYKLMDKIKIAIPGTTSSFTLEIGMVGPGEDWIYATCLGNNGDRIYLGCYSGKVYCLSKKGHVEQLYVCHDTIRSIREKGKRLFIETAYCLFIINDNRYLTHISTWQAGNLRWNTDGFMLVGEKTISLFSDEGVKKGQIEFKNRIYDAWLSNDQLKIVTANRTFAFSFC